MHSPAPLIVRHANETRPSADHVVSLFGVQDIDESFAPSLSLTNTILFYFSGGGRHILPVGTQCITLKRNDLQRIGKCKAQVI